MKEKLSMEAYTEKASVSNTACISSSCACFSGIQEIELKKKKCCKKYKKKGKSCKKCPRLLMN